MLFGAAALVGSFVLASFDKKTLVQQKEEISQAVTTKLEGFRAEKETACTEMVKAEATTRYQTFVAEEAAKPVVAGKKKPVGKGPKVTPKPQPAPPVKTTVDPQKSRGGAVQQGNVEQQKERGGAVQQGNIEQQKKRGGAVKQGGGK
ncbi:MAG: hypothetical protein RIQ78_1331 [Bacteroidota bacterium]